MSEPGAPAAQRRRLPLSTKILIGMLLGAALGTAANLLWKPDAGATGGTPWLIASEVARHVAGPLGRLFLNLLFMVVVPLVFSSLVVSVAEIGDVGHLGRMGRRMVRWVLGTTAFAVSIGLLTTNLAEPGAGLSDEQRAQLLAQYGPKAAEMVQRGAAGSGFSVDTFVAIVPRNLLDAASDNGKMLGLILFAMLAGIALTSMAGERTRAFREFLRTLYEICIKILGWTMAIAPFGVAGLLYEATLDLGLGVLATLSRYLAVALGGLLAYQFLILPLIGWLWAGVSPAELFRGCRGLWATAFGTSSSNATLPTTMRTAIDRFGVPERIANFVMPLGATLNMNGTALFEGVTVLFLAQVAGVPLTMADQLLVVLLAVLTAIGTAGVPGGSLPLLTVVLSTVHVPPELIGLIIGVDRLVDMTRTLPNVTSDLLCSVWIARKEGMASDPMPP